MPSTTRREAKRQAILTAASGLFLERGYEGTSMDAIQQRAGGSKATLYAHFKNKECLFESIVAEMVERPLFLPLARQQSGSAEEILLALGGKMLLALSSPWFTSLQRRVMESAQTAPEAARQFYANSHGKVLDELAAYFRRQHRKGILRCPRPEQAAQLFVGMIHGGFATRALCGMQPPAKAEQTAWVKHVVDAFLRLHARSG